jgi:hypothetical protein
LVLLGLIAVRLLLLYTPSGDVAQAASALATMEDPGEASALTEPLLTEAFQDAFDGRLWVWGVPSTDDVMAGQDATWAIGDGESDPAAARFQMGAVRLDYFSPAGQQFHIDRLPVPPLEGEASLGGVVELVAVQTGEMVVRPREALSLTLYWRALASMDTSYTVFVQAVDKEGVKVGQVDRLPCDGGCLTTTWRPGDLVGERYDLTISADAAPGLYQIIIGMYDLATGERLPALDAQGTVTGDYLLLGTVQVVR